MSRKVTIIGAGNVGATIAYTLSLGTIASEIVLIDINKEKVEGEVMYIVQCASFREPISVIAGDYTDAKDSDIVIITSGVGRKPGQTRIELAQTMVRIALRAESDIGNIRGFSREGAPATDVDHIIPHRGDKKLFWDSGNWQSLCHECHSRKSYSERRSTGRKKPEPDPEMGIFIIP